MKVSAAPWVAWLQPDVMGFVAHPNGYPFGYDQVWIASTWACAPHQRATGALGDRSQERTSMSTRIRIEFVDDGVTAVAELNEDAAPRSCAAVLAALPQEGDAHHAVYSGSEIAFILDRDLGVGPENATTKVIPGDFGYMRFEGGQYYGFPTSFSEVAWFYDRDAVPSMPDGPVRMNIIGTIVEGFEEFAQTCRAMRRSGTKRVRITVEE